MRLSDFENEAALDLLADIIEPAAEIMADKKVEMMTRSGKPVILVATYILKNHKKPAIEIIAALHGEKPETVRFNAITLLHDLVDLINEPMVRDLFTSQGQNTDAKRSGSAMANTTGEEQ